MNKDCNQVIEIALISPNGNGWAGFILHEKLRKVNIAVKAWHASSWAILKQKEDRLLKDLEVCDTVAESVCL